ncbi:MAG TPA: ATP-binding protein [Magnetospirillaceae bacterium]
MGPNSPIDARTVMLVHLPILLLLAALFAAIWRQNIGGRQALLWSLGHAAVAGGLLFSNLREFLPPIISAGLGFALLQTGMALTAWGVCIDVGWRFPGRAVLLFLSVIQVAQIYFLLVDPDTRMRVILGAVTVFVLASVGSIILAMDWRPYRRLPSRFTMCCLGLVALAHGTRLIGALQSTNQDFAGPPNQANFSFGAQLFVSLLASLGLGVGLLWLRLTDWHRTVANEIEERRRSEAALAVAKDAAEVAAQAKSRFLASVTHDIRTPMSAIIGLSRLLARTSLDDRQNTHVSRISTAATTLLELIEGVLDAARIEAGTMSVEARNFDLSDVLLRVDTIARVQAEAKGLTLAVIPARDVPMTLQGDPVRLGQVLLNIVGNAVKFTEAGEVTLSVGTVRQDLDSVELRFIIHDTGPGIAARELPRIFEPFRQGQNVGAGKSGAGLGLSIARQLLEMMGGSIHVRSVQGLGSTFTVDLPFRLAPFVSPAIDVPMSVRIDGVRILVAEDDEINREVAGEILTEAGAVVEMVATGRAAVDRLLVDGVSFDAVLMDVRMPEMDGMAATERIRAIYSAKLLPIIAVTAHAFDEERDACVMVGMTDFVTKPIEPARLLMALARALPSRVTLVDVQPTLLPLPPMIPGFDIAGTLGRFCGNTSTVQRLLTRFSTRFAEAQASLHEAVNEGRLDDACAWVHGFRGAAATLGAVILTTQAAKLEAALRAGDQALVPEEIAALTREMETAANELKVHGFS